MWKKADMFLTIALCALCAAAFLLIPRGGDTVVIRQGGKEIYRGSLLEDAVMEVEGAYHNTIEIRDGKAAYVESDCPGKDCVHRGFITEGSAACAPNGSILIIERTAEKSGVDVVAE